MSHTAEGGGWGAGERAMTGLVTSGARPWTQARAPLNTPEKMRACDSFYDGAKGGADTPLSQGQTERPETGRTGGSNTSTSSRHRRRHHRDGSTTIRNHGTGNQLQMPEEGIDFARSHTMGVARHHYLDALARKDDMEKKHDSEILERRRQAEYAAHMQREMRQELERQRADFLKLQAEAKNAHQRREKEYRMAPTTLYPSSVPHGRSALWTDQYQRDVASMMKETYLTDMDIKASKKKEEKDKTILQERALLEKIAEGMVLDHVAQQAHKNGMRRELLDELHHSKKPNANQLPYDCFRPCVD